jgi:glycosyltransferase involved in cell wall biosynthesis
VSAAASVAPSSASPTDEPPALGHAEPRVLHVVCAGEAAGAERLLVDLLAHAKTTRASHAVALFTPSERVAAHFARPGFRIFDRGRVRENPLAYLWRSLGPTDTAWLEGVIRSEGANVVHLHTFASHVLGTRAALRAGAKIVRTEHDTRYFVDPSCSPFTRWSLRRSHAVVAIASHVADYVKATAPYAADRISIVRNGVDTEYFSPRPTRPASASAEARAPFTFVMACRLEPHKQVDVAIEALARVPQVRLIVVGDGSQRAKLEAHARAHRVADRVELRGFVADPRDTIAEADVGLSASRHEPFGLSVVEAMAMARPVVAFAVGGIREIVQAGKTGLLAQSLTVSELAVRMQEAADRPDRMRAMGVRAREFVVREFGVEAMCRGYADVYEHLARI